MLTTATLLRSQGCRNNDDCALFVALNPHKDSDEIVAIIDEAVDLYNDLKTRANHPEEPKKAYYNGLTKEMFEKLDELCEKLSAVVSKQE